jgi:hypothetical protein
MFNPYRRWLGIPCGRRRATPYELLGIVPGEHRAEVIREAALRQSARVRPYQTGPFADESSRVLNEIARAELALLNEVRPAKYEATHGGEATAEAGDSCPAETENVGTPAAVFVLPQDDTPEAEIPVLESLATLQAQQPHGCGRPRYTTRTPFRGAPALAAAGAFLLLAAATALGVRSTLAGRTLGPGGSPAAEPATQPPLPESLPLRDGVGELRCFPGQMPVYGVAFSPDGRSILSGGGGYVKGRGNSVLPRECAARLWDVETGEEVRRFSGHTAPVHCVCFSPDGRRALSGAGGYENRNGPPAAVDCTVRLWDVGSGRELRRFTGHTAPVTSVAFFPNGRTAVSAGRDGTVRLWDVRTGAELRCLEPEPGAVNSVAVSPDGRFLLCGGEEGMMRLWVLGDQQGPPTFPRLEGRITCVAFSPDEQQALCASGRWDVRDGCHEPVTGGLGLWDLETVQSIRSYTGHEGPVASVAFSSDGRRAVSSGSDSMVRLWDVASGRELYRFEGHTGSVDAVAISADGRRAASAGQDRTIRVWVLPQ